LPCLDTCAAKQCFDEHRNITCGDESWWNICGGLLLEMATCT
jgi:hypothetical protein